MQQLHLALPAVWSLRMGGSLWLVLAWMLLPAALAAQRLPPQRPAIPSISRVQPQLPPFATYRQHSYPDPNEPDSLGQRWIGTDTVLMNLDTLHRWDEALEAGSFQQTLGLIGKPYLRWQYGLPGRLYAPGLWQNTFSNQPSAYFIRFEDQEFYDAYRPLVHVHFNQSSFNTQLLRVTLSQNLLPAWNSTLHYRRRTAQGNYRNMVTDHYNLYWNHWIHTRDFRYQLFAGVSWQELTDGLNGGVVVEEDTPLDEVFEGAVEPIVLENARLEQWLRTANLKQLWQPFRQDWLQLMAEGYYSQYFQRYRDPAVYTSLNDQRYRPYGQLLNGDTTVQHSYQYRVYGGRGHVQLRGQLGPLAAELRGLGQYEVRELPLGLRQTKTGLGAEGQLGLRRPTDAPAHADKPGAWLQGRYLLHTNDLLDTETEIRLGLHVVPRLRTFRMLDSTAVDTVNYRIPVGLRRPLLYEGYYQPLHAWLEGQLYSLNPALQQYYWQSSTYAANRSLGNEEVRLLRATLQYTYSQPRIRRGLPYRQSYLKISPFYSEVRDFIYTNARAETRQTGSAYRFVGLAVEQLQRLGRFYLYGQVQLQQAHHSGDSLAAYDLHLPKLYGRARIFWEDKFFKTPADIQLGLEASFRSNFEALSLEPSLQLGYPQLGRSLQPYLQLDAWLALRIQTAHVYVKVIHLNQNLPDPGFFTTPFYPMLHRSFTFGVSWRLFS